MWNQKKQYVFHPIRLAPSEHVTELRDLGGVIKVDAVLSLRMSLEGHFNLFLVWHPELNPQLSVAEDIPKPDGWLLGLEESVRELLSLSVTVNVGDHARKEVLKGLHWMQRCLHPETGEDIPVVMTQVYCEIVKSRRKGHIVRKL